MENGEQENQCIRETMIKTTIGSKEKEETREKTRKERKQEKEEDMRKKTGEKEGNKKRQIRTGRKRGTMYKEWETDASVVQATIENGKGNTNRKRDRKEKMGNEPK